MKINKAYDELIQGIDFIISKNRCSFSGEDIALLKQCQDVIRELKTEDKLDFKAIIDILALVSNALGIFKDMF